MFEVCAHQWADLSEFDCGLALINDCKYGYSCHRNNLQLSVLRAPTRPDPQCDEGEHQFRFGVLPHWGTFQKAEVIAQANHFNNPPLFRCLSVEDPTLVSYFRCSDDSVIIETVKRSENGEGIVLRLYESFGGRTSVAITVHESFQINNASITDLLEQPSHTVSRDGRGRFLLSFTPFQIVTLLLSS